MALKKEIILKNGIILNYHRIVSINTITNISSVIEVASYINETQREKEKKWYETCSNDNMNVYIETRWYTLKYDKTLNVDSAYAYLKTLDDFKDSEDILEFKEEKVDYTMNENNTNEMNSSEGI